MDLSEIQLLKKIREIVALSQKKALVGVGDDCAVLPGRKGYNYLFTTDSMVENVHFDLKFTSLYQVGWKVVAANASDIAAMGGVPLFAVVSLGLPERFVFSEVEELYRGMMDLSLKLGLEINGGDVVVSSVFFITLSVIGEVEEGRAILRSGAKPGD
ncbi:thiamine-phosphate kinase, partial [Candidatus Aerophobetes bacterium]|nr:thiamine-phosphate kinase [Candidatus Aerophobetes bacterium]